MWKKGRSWRALALLTVLWRGNVRKTQHKKHGLIPSDEGRVRNPIAVQTMFAMGDALGPGRTEHGFAARN